MKYAINNELTSAKNTNRTRNKSWKRAENWYQKMAHYDDDIKYRCNNAWTIL